jgi:hypothetical protein
MFGLISKALGGTCNEPQPVTFREILQMLGANARKVRNLCVSEDFLTRFSGDHNSSPCTLWSPLRFNNLDDERVACEWESRETAPSDP